jgi:ubiquitin carboxyl-terminal hydrolase 48
MWLVIGIYWSLERLYAKQHPTHVSKFEATCNIDLELGSYWISKPWVKGEPIVWSVYSILTEIDWKLVKPKMHTFAKGDLPPDSEEYQSHVRCEHGGLCLNPTNRCRISSQVNMFCTLWILLIVHTQAFNLLRSLFPAWEPMSGDMEPCLVCDGLMNMGMEDRLEVRRRADDEKV